MNEMPAEESYNGMSRAEVSPLGIRRRLLSLRHANEHTMQRALFTETASTASESIWGRVLAARVLASRLEPKTAETVLAEYGVIFRANVINRRRLHDSDLPEKKRWRSQLLSAARSGVTPDVFDALLSMAEGVVAAAEVRSERSTSS